MAGGHKIDVVGPPALKVEVDLRDLSGRSLDSLTVLAQGKVLTEVTGQIAPGKENGSRSSCSGETGLLPKVEIRGRHFRQGPRSTRPLLPRKTVDPAVAGAGPTGEKGPVSLGNFFPNLRREGIFEKGKAHGSFPRRIEWKLEKTERAS